MDSILINGQDVPVLNPEDEGLPLINHKGHRGVVASSEEDAAKLMFDGITFWCPVGLIRPSVGDENIRKEPPTKEGLDILRNLARIKKDIGTIKIVEDSTGQTPFRILDGNHRFPLFLETCNPSHVFVQYCEMAGDDQAIENSQQIANIGNKHTEMDYCFAALKAKQRKDAGSIAEDEFNLAVGIAGGKTMFVKRYKRAKNAIPALWEAFGTGKITIESLDAIATLINPDSGEILADLQKSVLDSAIANNLKTSQVTAKVAAALANWQAEWEASQQVLVPEPVEDIEEELFAITPAKGAGRPVSATAPKTTKPPANPKPPVEKVTAAAVVQQKQEVKAAKGKSGRKPSAPSATKVMTNAPASIPAAIAANPNVHIAVIGRGTEPKLVDVDIFQELLNVEEALLKSKCIVISNTEPAVAKDAWAKMESMSLKGIDDVLSQVKVLRDILSKIEQAASAVQMDLKDQQ